jgi:hypothetical protein
MMQSVQVIIERLKSHPEDFFGDSEHRGRAPKFMGIAEKLDDLLSHKQEGFIHRLWYLNEDEKEALIEAYREARRARFEAQVFHDLLSSREPDLPTERTDASGKRLMQGWTDPRAAGAQVQTQSMLKQATKILSDEFDKAYAKNRNT